MSDKLDKCIGLTKYQKELYHTPRPNYIWPAIVVKLLGTRREEGMQ